MASCSGKTALVTDASQGAGRAAALALAKAGAQVLVHHHRKVARAEAVVEEIRAVGGKALAIAGDIAASEGPHELARRAREIVGERLDVLVVNASVEMLAADALIQQLLPILGRSASIIFTAPLIESIATVVNHFAPLLRPRGIRVNAIAPIAKAQLQGLGATVTFLASNEASRITGETLRIESSVD